MFALLLLIEQAAASLAVRVVVEDNDVITQPHPDGCVCRTGPVAVRVEQSESGADAEADAARQALAGSVL